MGWPVWNGIWWPLLPKYTTRISSCRELLLSGDLDSSDYKTVKVEGEAKIAVLAAKLSEILINLMERSELEEILDKAIETFTGLDKIFYDGDVVVQRKIIGSMYPEKFTFEKLKHLTAKASFLFSLIYQINNTLCGKKRRASDRKTCLPTLAPETVYFSRNLLDDLTRISKINEDNLE